MATEIKLTGRLIEIRPTVTFESGFMKREVLLRTDGEYSEELMIEFWKDKCAVLGNYLPGEAVEVSVNIRGNEYNGKHYVKLQGWMIHHDKSAAGEALPEVDAAPESYVTEPVQDDQGTMLF
jgi:single-strand DNA-binding protein